MNEYFNHTGSAVSGTLARATNITNPLDQIASGFDKLPTEDNIKTNTICFGHATLEGTTYKLSIPHPPAVYKTGMQVSFFTENVNTGAANLDIMGRNGTFLGVKPIRRIDGTNLRENDIPANSVILLVFQGSHWISLSNAGDIVAVQLLADAVQRNTNNTIQSEEIATAKAEQATQAAQDAEHFADQAQAIAGLDFTADQFGLGNVDNTPDLEKPISNLTQQALDQKADLQSAKYIDTDYTAHNGDNLAIASEVGSINITSPEDPQDGYIFRTGDAEGAVVSKPFFVHFGTHGFRGVANQILRMNKPYLGLSFVFFNGTWHLLP